MKKLIVTHSSKTLFLNCRMKYKHNYEDLLSPKGSRVYLATGTLMHEALGSLVGGEPLDLVMAQLRANIVKARKLFLGADTEKFESAASSLEGMITAWDGNRGLFNQLEPYIWDGQPSVEVPFSIPLGNEVFYEGKIDCVMQDKKKPKQLWIGEHKSTGRLDEAYVKRLPLDEQVTGYIFALKTLLPKADVQGVIYNVIKKPGIRLKKNQTPEQYNDELFNEFHKYPQEYFYQAKMYRTAEQLAAFEREIRWVADEIRAREQDGRWVHNSSFCTHYGLCEYLPLCTHGKQPHISAMFTKRDEKHPELTSEEA